MATNNLTLPIKPPVALFEYISYTTEDPPLGLGRSGLRGRGGDDRKRLLFAPGGCLRDPLLGARRLGGRRLLRRRLRDDFPACDLRRTAAVQAAGFHGLSPGNEVIRGD